MSPWRLPAPQVWEEGLSAFVLKSQNPTWRDPTWPSACPPFLVRKVLNQRRWSVLCVGPAVAPKSFNFLFLFFFFFFFSIGCNTSFALFCSCDYFLITSRILPECIVLGSSSIFKTPLAASLPAVWTISISPAHLQFLPGVLTHSACKERDSVWTQSIRCFRPGEERLGLGFVFTAGS